MEELLLHLKQSSIFRVGLYPLSSSLATLSQATHSVDLMIYMVGGGNGQQSGSYDGNGTKNQTLPVLQAMYNQRLFSSSRVSFILAQLIQIIQNAAADSQRAVGQISLMTETQLKLLPDPKKDLHWYGPIYQTET